MMLQTEGGFDTCAQKRIEICEHLGYLAHGLFQRHELRTHKKNTDIRAEITAIPAVGVQNLIVKLIGVVIAGASILFYLNGTIELVYTIVMLLFSFIVFESLDAA